MRRQLAAPPRIGQVHRREAQEAHAQADAAMRRAYSLERDALTLSQEAANRELAG
jgi:hypothetical protein